MKAQVDIIYLMSLLFGVIVGTVLFLSIWGQFTSNATSNSLFQATPQGASAEQSATKAIDIDANAIVFIYVFANVAALIASFFANSNPVFAVLGIIVFPIELIFSFIYHDLFFLMIQNSFLAPVATAFPIMVNFMAGLPFFVGIFAVAIIITTFSKS